MRILCSLLNSPAPRNLVCQGSFSWYRIISLGDSGLPADGNLPVTLTTISTGIPIATVMLPCSGVRIATVFLVAMVVSIKGVKVLPSMEKNGAFPKITIRITKAKNNPPARVPIIKSCLLETNSSSSWGFKSLAARFPRANFTDSGILSFLRSTQLTRLFLASGIACSKIKAA